MSLRIALVSALVCVLGCGDAPKSAPPLREPQLRGVIEGFYGPPYTPEDRAWLFEALPAHGFSTYFYGPKQDPYHRAQWREPYPEETLAHFAELTARGREIGVRFVFTLSPGLSFDPSGDDPGRVRDKLDALFDRGVRDFCLFFDDLLPNSPGADPEVQIDLLRAMRRHLRARDPNVTLCFTPPYYFGTAEALATDAEQTAPLPLPTPSSVHYEAYRALPSDIAIFWTGTGVFSSALASETVTAYRAFVERPVFLWDNFPVNDTLVANELFLGPYASRTPALGHIADGVVLNLAKQPRASLIAVVTASLLLEQGEAYDPDVALAEAITEIGGTAAPHLTRLAEHCAGHPLIADAGEAVRLSALTSAFASAPSATTLAPLRDELVALTEVRAGLEAGLTDGRLYAELEPFATKLDALARAALLAADAYTLRAMGGAPDLVALDAAIGAARGLPMIVGANTDLPGWLVEILGDTDPEPHSDVWEDLFDVLRAATLAL